MMSVPRVMEREILLCFADMYLGDALKLLRMSSHTMMRLRRENGLTKWPFDLIKRRTYTMSWDDVQALRTAQLKRDDLDEDTRRSLEGADKRAWLMRRLYTPSEANCEVPDDFFEADEQEASEMAAALEAPAPKSEREPEPAPEGEREPEPAEPCMLEQDLPLFDEEEWGILGPCLDDWGDE